MFVDIHSHILPGVDDGARNIEETKQLLEMYRNQGVEVVVATPHFYADYNNFENTKKLVEKAAKTVSENLLPCDPKIFLGYELRYFKGIGSSSSVSNFVINGTNYCLLELDYGSVITDEIVKDICNIYENMGIVPILAHIERFCNEKGFAKLLKCIDGVTLMAHINADFLNNKLSKDTLKLIKSKKAQLIACDTHSVDRRPPRLIEALDYIEQHLGKQYKQYLVENGELFYNNVLKNSQPING